MPKKRTIRMSKAVRDMAPLRSEVRALGAALGRVITRIEGRETFDTVEVLRKLAKARRAGDTDAEKLLAQAVAGLDPIAAFNQAMAFTLYFELVNLAEENFRIILLRRRRVARALGRDDGRPIRESIEAAVMELKAAGVGADEMQRLVDRLGIELVFTAHPTETKRRTLLAKLRRLAAILRARAMPESTPDSAVLDEETVEREIASLWLTDRSRTVRPEVKDEARTGLWYFDTTLIETMPRLQVDMEKALQRHYPGVRPPRRWLTFGSWIGGDRDGNPEVTATTTAEVLILHRRLAIEKLRATAGELGRMLTVSDRRDTVVPALKHALREDLHLSKHLDELEKRYPHEPYRLLLGVLHERLGQARDELRDGRALLGGAVVGSCSVPLDGFGDLRHHQGGASGRPRRDAGRWRTRRRVEPVRGLRPAHRAPGPEAALGAPRGRGRGDPRPAGLPRPVRGGQACRPSRGHSRGIAVRAGRDGEVLRGDPRRHRPSWSQ